MIRHRLNTIWMQFLPISFQDWLVLGSLVLVSVILVSSLGRVVTNARNNYEVYVFEKEGLQELKAEQARLLQELAYYESFEYKKLYARENLFLGEPGERLYKLTEPPKLYQVRVREKDYFTDTNFTAWWMKLL
jgi:cell division protein FtsB